jgi:hypothetical protein
VQKIRGVGAVYVYTFRDGFDGPFDLIPHSSNEKTMSDDIYSDFFLNLPSGGDIAKSENRCEPEENRRAMIQVSADSSD